MTLKYYEPASWDMFEASTDSEIARFIYIPATQECPPVSAYLAVRDVPVEWKGQYMQIMKKDGPFSFYQQGGQYWIIIVKRRLKPRGSKYPLTACYTTEFRKLGPEPSGFDSSWYSDPSTVKLNTESVKPLITRMELLLDNG